MEYTVKWIINGEILVNAESKDEAEAEVKSQLKESKGTNHWNQWEANQNQWKVSQKSVKELEINQDN